MCRFALYLGPEITISSVINEPAHSIVHQSFDSSEQASPLNGDGFGLAWYVPDLSEEPAIFKDVSPAWNNLNLLNLARVTRSRCVLAHVRAATRGIAVAQSNCHPFARGPFAFAHNGRVADYLTHKRLFLERLSSEAFQQIAGSTDSEFLFALFSDHYRCRRPHEDRLQAMARALASTIAEVENLRKKFGTKQASLLNLAVTDGYSAVCSRFCSPGPTRANSLYFCTGTHCRFDKSLTGMTSLYKDRNAVVVASEPFSRDGNWTKLSNNSILLVDRDFRVETKPLSEAFPEDTKIPSWPIDRTDRPKHSAQRPIRRVG